MAQVYKVVPLKIYQKLLQNNNNSDNNSSLQEVNDENEKQKQDVVVIQDKVKKIISNLDSSQQTNATIILNKLLDHGKFDWTVEGQITYNDKEIPFSYLPQLINIATTNGSTKTINFGLESFLCALNEAKIDNKYLSKNILQLISNQEGGSKVQELNSVPQTPAINSKPDTSPNKAQTTPYTWITFEDCFKF